MRTCKPPRAVLVGYSADEALGHLRRDPTLPVRVRWLLDASTAATLHATLTSDQGAEVTCMTFVDSFHGSDDLPALGWWLRRRDMDGSADAISWCMRVARRVKSHPDNDNNNNNRDESKSDGITLKEDNRDHTDPVAREIDDDGATRHRRGQGRPRVYVHNDIDDDGHLVAMVAPESGARDLSALCLGLYARVSVGRTTYHLAAGPHAAPALCVVVDRVALGGSGAGSVALQGTAVVRDPAAAQRLINALTAAGVDTSRAPPPSKVAAYLVRRRPALYARLVQRGALDPSS
ncbi:CYTH-like domain motif-containing protein [Pandoravirus inopinatum]|uniref:CYTH-like domain motif-containing protein n=1 Tax=Pandoravirus inopinatum TaxID=1605721 RepID=A0A0B5JBA1_9VIRU|nr:CYTH-like domain motif-containing protein [Pandoravirus inopinatum]AJF96832.1 CYTH-like domain motif-containing protein [Pandoravirus inopinatum]